MDEYKVNQLRTMLEREADPKAVHYGAYLMHPDSNAKNIIIDAGGLKASIDYYTAHDTDLGNEN